MSQYIKSIQVATVTHTASGGAGTPYTLSPSVTAANAIILWNGWNTNKTSSSVFWDSAGRWSLSSTQATYTKGGTAATTTTAKATVVEFNSDVVSNVTDDITITAAATSQTYTLPAAVDTTKAFVIWNGVTPSATTQNFTGTWGVALELTNSTTVTARIGFALAADITVSFTVIEFTSNIISKVVKISPLTLTSANAADTSTISSVTVANSLIFMNGFTAASDLAALNYAYTAELTNSTTVTWTRVGTSTGTRSLYATVVEFQSGALNGSVQRGTVSNPGGTGAVSTSGGTVSPSVTTSLSWVQHCGLRVNSGQNLTQTHLVLGASAVTATTNGTYSATSVNSWEVIQFDNTAPSGSADAVPLWQNIGLGGITAYGLGAP